MVVPSLLPHLGLRPDVDFTPIVKVSRSYNVWSCAILSGEISFRARCHSEETVRRYNFSSAGFGTPAHLAGEMFKLETGGRRHACSLSAGTATYCDLLMAPIISTFLRAFRLVISSATGRLPRACRHSAAARCRDRRCADGVEQGFPNLVLEDYVGYAVKSARRTILWARLNEAINRALKKAEGPRRICNSGRDARRWHARRVWQTHPDSKCLLEQHRDGVRHQDAAVILPRDGFLTVLGPTTRLAHCACLIHCDRAPVLGEVLALRQASALGFSTSANLACWRIVMGTSAHNPRSPAQALAWRSASTHQELALDRRWMRQAQWGTTWWLVPSTVQNPSRGKITAAS